MSLIALIAKNVLNRPVRTGLTAFGLSIAISAVIILVGISWNFERSFMAIYRSKKIDLIVVHAGSSNQLSSSLDVRLADRLKQVEGVADVAPTLVDTVAFEEQNLASVLVNGWLADSLLFRGIRILEGRALKPGDQKSALLGRVLAINLNKKVGDRLNVSGETFEVVGIFESESLFENGGPGHPAGNPSEDDGARGPGHRVRDHGQGLGPGVRRFAEEADRGRHPERRGDPGSGLCDR